MTYNYYFVINWSENLIEKQARKDGKMDTAWLELAVPAMPSQFLTREVEKLNHFFTILEKFIDIKERKNPLTLTGEEINKLPQGLSWHPNRASVKLFRQGIYNSPGHTIESQIGIFGSSAVLHATEEDADLFEQLLIKNMGNSIVVYRRGKIVGGVIMYNKKMRPTKAFLDFVDFLERNGFSTTRLGLKLPK